MMITEFLAGLTLTTKVVAVTGAVAVASAAAGAAGVLPTQAESSTEQSIAAEVETPADPDAEVTVTTPDAAEFGTSVAEMARDGGVDGASVAAEARTQGQTGLDQAGGTPAAEHVPDDTPAGPPDSTPAEAVVDAEAQAEAQVGTSVAIPSPPSVEEITSDPALVSDGLGPATGPLARD